VAPTRSLQKISSEDQIDLFDVVTALALEIVLAVELETAAKVGKSNCRSASLALLASDSFPDRGRSS
jgi:hypothetical protein